MKDHEKRELVDALTKVAVEFAGAQQLRERIAQLVRTALHRNEAKREADREQRQAEPAPGFGIDAEKLDKLRTNGLKPEEIAGPADKQHARVTELVHWFARLADGHANPKWTREHAFELAYYVATEGKDRGLDLRTLLDDAWARGVNIKPSDRDALQRMVPERFPPHPAAPDSPR